MFNLLCFVSIIFTIKAFVKEKTEPVAPKGTRFDYDAYWEDVRNGIGAMEQVKKIERGEYYTTKPKPIDWWDLPLDTIVDVERYEHDKQVYGEHIVTTWRSNGRYRCVKKF